MIRIASGHRDGARPVIVTVVEGETIMSYVLSISTFRLHIVRHGMVGDRLLATQRWQQQSIGKDNELIQTLTPGGCWDDRAVIAFVAEIHRVTREALA